MAHSGLHFAVGMAAGMAVAAGPMVRAWRARAAVAPAARRWLVCSWAVGLWAIIPGLARYAGVPDPICDGVWMNAFVLYPALNALLPWKGVPVAAVALLGCFLLQYGVLLAAVRRASR